MKKTSSNYEIRYNDMVSLYNYINRVLNIDINKKSKKEDYIAGRSMFAYICYNEYDLTFIDIATFLSKSVSNHSTVFHSINVTFHSLVGYREKYKHIYKKTYDKFNAFNLLNSDKLKEQINKIRKHQVENNKQLQILLKRLLEVDKSSKEKNVNN